MGEFIAKPMPMGPRCGASRRRGHGCIEVERAALAVCRVRGHALRHRGRLHPRRRAARRRRVWMGMRWSARVTAPGSTCAPGRGAAMPAAAPVEASGEVENDGRSGGRQGSADGRAGDDAATGCASCPSPRMTRCRRDPLDVARIREDFPILGRTVHGQPPGLPGQRRHHAEAAQRDRGRCATTTRRTTPTSTAAIHTLADEATEAYEARPRARSARFWAG